MWFHWSAPNVWLPSFLAENKPDVFCYPCGECSVLPHRNRDTRFIKPWCTVHMHGVPQYEPKDRNLFVDRQQRAFVWTRNTEHPPAVSHKHDQSSQTIGIFKNKLASKPDLSISGDKRSNSVETTSTTCFFFIFKPALLNTDARL